MQGITCLKRCGASIQDIKEYCRLCRLEESEENLRARYRIILRQRDQARKRVEEAQATAAYMDQKAKHYEDILAGRIPDDTNPGNWTLDDLSFRACKERTTRKNAVIIRITKRSEYENGMD